MLRYGHGESMRQQQQQRQSEEKANNMLTKSKRITVKSRQRYTLSDGLWYPRTGDTIDKRCPGKKSKAAVRRQLNERREFTGEHVVAIFHEAGRGEA